MRQAKDWRSWQRYEQVETAPGAHGAEPCLGCFQTHIRPDSFAIRDDRLPRERSCARIWVVRQPDPGLPPEFAYPAAFGDLVTAILAFAAIPLVLRGSRLARPIVWVFNIFGTVDLLLAITTGTIYNAVVAMGPAYWIPAFWVPLLLVTHYVTFVILRRGGTF